MVQIQRIAGRVGMSRKTVKRYITEYETLAQADSEDRINMCLARVLIWHSMIPELNDMDAKTLAAKYDFSGGQIENIARHYTIDSILHDAKEDKLAMLINHCDNERVDDNSKRHIGF